MRGMVKALAAASAIALSATAANAATTIITPSAPPPGTTFQVFGNPFTGTDPVTAILGHGGIPTGSFTDMFEFTIGSLGQGIIGSGSGGLTTNITFGGIGGLTDVNFLSVLVNGIAATGHYTDLNGVACTTYGVGSCGAGETFTIAGVPITGGMLNNITVNGTVGGPRGIGSYGGSATFLPVPEPATWAMMLLGFLGIGSVMSRRRRKQNHLLQLA